MKKQEFILSLILLFSLTLHLSIIAQDDPPEPIEPIDPFEEEIEDRKGICCEVQFGACHHPNGMWFLSASWVADKSFCP